MRERRRWDEREAAYVHVQQTKPWSLAHALADSPAGLAAWILEKCHAWSDVPGRFFDHFSSDDLLGTLSLYWLTNTIGTSLIPYHVYDMKPGPPRLAASRLPPASISHRQTTGASPRAPSRNASTPSRAGPSTNAAGISSPPRNPTSLPPTSGQRSAPRVLTAPRHRHAGRV